MPEMPQKFLVEVGRDNSSPRSLLRDSRGLFNCELVPLKAKGKS